MDKRNLVKESADAFCEDEARAERLVKRVSLARCVLGPVVILGFLIGTAHWEPASASARQALAAGHIDYFPANYVNAASTIEDHVQAF